MDASNNSDILVQVASQVLAVGASEFEIEYKDGEEQVFAFNGPVGISVAAFGSQTAEAEQLRKELCRLRRERKKFTLRRTEFVMKVRVYDSSGEDAFRVTIIRS